MDAVVRARARRLPGARVARAQVLAPGWPHRQRLRRPQRDVHVPTARELRGLRRSSRRETTRRGAVGAGVAVREEPAVAFRDVTVAVAAPMVDAVPGHGEEVARAARLGA